MKIDGLQQVTRLDDDVSVTMMTCCVIWIQVLTATRPRGRPQTVFLTEASGISQQREPFGAEIVGLLTRRVDAHRRVQIGQVTASLRLARYTAHSTASSFRSFHRRLPLLGEIKPNSVSLQFTQRANMGHPSFVGLAAFALFCLVPTRWWR